PDLQQLPQRGGAGGSRDRQPAGKARQGAGVPAAGADPGSTRTLRALRGVGVYCFAGPAPCTCRGNSNSVGACDAGRARAGLRGTAKTASCVPRFAPSLALNAPATPPWPASGRLLVTGGMLGAAF